MAKAKKKRRWLKICFLCFIVYFTSVMFIQQVQISSQKTELIQLQDELDFIERNNKEMTDTINAYERPDYVEYILRIFLGYVKQNEIKYIAE